MRVMMTTSSVFISDENNLKSIAIYYHVYQHGGWLDLVSEQLELLHSSGLYEACSFIHIGVNGSDKFPFSADKYHIEYNKEPWSEETPTLLSLRDFCLNNNGWKVLYFHTKGVTQVLPQTIHWRKAMEYFCIERWQECLDQLNYHDTTGCLYTDNCYYGFYPHYSGNFWWVKSEYIKKLDDSYLHTGIRQNREFWIGTGDGSMHSFFNIDLNLYAIKLLRETYAI